MSNKLMRLLKMIALILSTVITSYETARVTSNAVLTDREVIG